MTANILAFAKENLEQGKKAVLVTVTETCGSSPASAGQLMVVLADGSSAGTVGGGITEHKIKQRAIEAIKNKERVFSFFYDHAENGMVCGGSMSGYGNILGEESHLYIFGGGHIAQCLAQLAAASGFFVSIIEDRPEFESQFNKTRYILCKPEEYEKKIHFSGSEYAVICTRGHKTDNDALRFCLSKPLAYLGMIGSIKKTETIFAQLREEGFTDDKLKKIYSPIGLDIGNIAPSEIAVSILAEMFLVKNNGSPNHKKLYKT